MKRKGIFFSSIGLLIVSILVVVLISKNHKEYISFNGSLLALTIDGKTTTSFPTSKNYFVNVKCKNGNGKWLVDEWKFVIEDITDSVICDIDFITRTVEHKLINVVESSTEQYYAINNIDNSTFSNAVKLVAGITHFDVYNDKTYPFEIKNSNANVWVSTNRKHNTKSSIVLVPKIENGYQICYKISSEDLYDYGNVYVDDELKLKVSGNNKEEYTCKPLGILNSENEIKIEYFKDSNGTLGEDSIEFYVEKGDYLEDIDSNPVSVGYRYSGKNPNNWIVFNNEMWRIIGSVPTKLNNGSTKNLIKIMKYEVLGSYSYDASSEDDTILKGAWGSNTLYSLLNEQYYSSSKNNMFGQSHKGCYSGYTSDYKSVPNCDFRETGILSTSNYGSMVENVYWNTGAIDYYVTAGDAYLKEKEKQTVLGHVGLISISDWIYASDEDYHNRLLNFDVNLSTTNWIFNCGYEWTITQIGTMPNRTWYLAPHGAFHLHMNNIISRGYSVRPVVYLDPDLYAISGDGSELHPYVISY